MPHATANHVQGAHSFRDWARGWWRALAFAGTALAGLITPAFYTETTRALVVRQIYFTAWQILARFTVFMALLAFVLVQIIVETTRAYGLAEYTVELLLRVIVLEMVPLGAALFVALRSGSAINTEIALMTNLNELEALRRAGVDPVRFELVPRVVAGALSVMSLTAINIALVLVISYIGMYGAEVWGLPHFTRAVGGVFGPVVGFGLLLKCFLFGLAVAAIPIAEGLAVQPGMQSVPVSVLQGMMRLFFTLILIEVLSLTALYI